MQRNTLRQSENTLRQSETSESTTDDQESRKNADRKRNPKKAPLLHEHRQSSKEDRDLWSSTITATKIERYFGKVEHVKSVVILPLKGYHDIIETMLASMNDLMIKEGIDVSFPSTVVEFHKLIEDEIPKKNKDIADEVENVMVDILGSLMACNPRAQPEISGHWYNRLSNMIETHLDRNKSITTDTQKMLYNLIKVCLLETQSEDAGRQSITNSSPHFVWSLFWNTLLEPINFGHNEGHFIRKGECKEQIRIRPVKKVKLTKKKDLQSPSTSTKSNDEVIITVEPDFMACTVSKQYVGTQAETKEATPVQVEHILRIAVVGEIQTAKHDCQYSPPSSCESNTESWNLSNSQSQSPQTKSKIKQDSDTRSEKQNKLVNLAGNNEAGDLAGKNSDEEHLAGKNEAGDLAGKNSDEEHLAGKNEAGDLAGKYNTEKKDSRLDHLKTQHFTDLLCMLRQSNSLDDNSYETVGLGDHVFGWYSVKNTVYFTCLTVYSAGSNKIPGFFPCNHKSASFLLQNKTQGFMFKQFCFPPLNVFNADHFKVLLAMMKYLIWGRRSLFDNLHR